MNKTPMQWLRSGLSMLLALCLAFSTPVTVLADTSTTYCTGDGAAQTVVDDAVYYCTNSQKVIDLIVSYVIDGEYAKMFEGSSTSSFIKSMAIDMIKDELDDNEDLMIKMGFEPTDENKELLADEIYYVACIYYDEMHRDGGSRESANELSMLEVIRFCLVETKGYSDADAQEAARMYYDVYAVYSADGETAAIEKAKTYDLASMNIPHTYDTPVWTWGEGYATASAAFSCTGCDHTQNVTATVTSATTDASCTAEGSTTYTATAILDGVEYTDAQTVAIAATGHSYGTETWTWADDFSSAKVSRTCTKCSSTIENDATVTSETTPATCTADGSTVYTAKATLDGEEYTSTMTVTLPGGHTYDDPTWNWSDDYDSASAVFTCSVCGESETKTATVTSQTTDATCVEDGSIVYTASVTVNGKEYSDTKSETIAANGTHNYGEPTWTWANDYSTATVSQSCVDCNESIAAVGTVTTTTTDATCTTDGTITHTATATLNGTERSDTQTETIAATGHTYAESVWTWAEDYSTASVAITCTVCEETQTADATITTEATEAACTTGGTITHTAAATIDGKEYTDVQTVTVEATGHTEVVDEAIAATCTESGLTEGSHCSVCGEVLTAQETIEATGHSYTSVVTDPTCEQDGYTTYTCSVCGDTYTDNYVDALGHNYVNGVCTICNGTTAYIEAPVVDVENILSSGKIRLTWDEVDNAVSYDVYYSATESVGYKLLKTVTGSKLNHTSAKAGETFYYYVVSVAEDGTVSEASNIVTRTCDLARPSVTLGNKASTGKVTISWEAVEGAVKYEVWRSIDGGENYARLSTTKKTAITNTSAEAGVTYYYKVKAIAENSAADSAYSSPKYRTCDLAQTSITLRNVESTGKIRISWEAVDGAVKYNIYRSTDGENFTKLSSTKKTAITNTSAEPGVTYYYKVKAIAENSSANSADSDIKSRVCDLAQPKLSVSLTSSGKPRLSWEAVDGAVKYYIYSSTDGENFTKLTSTKKTAITNTSAEAGVTYYYMVKAIAETSDANSVYSNVVSVTAG